MATLKNSWVELLASASTALLVVIALIFLPFPRAQTKRSVASEPLTTSTRYSIDSVSFGTTTIILHWHPQPKIAPPRDVDLIFSGWAADDSSVRKLPSAVTAVVDGRASYPATLRLARADVATFLRDPALGRSGFRLTIPRCALTAGSHIVAFRIAAAGAMGYYRSTDNVALNVEPATCPAN